MDIKPIRTKPATQPSAYGPSAVECLDCGREYANDADDPAPTECADDCPSQDTATDRLIAALVLALTAPDGRQADADALAAESFAALCTPEEIEDAKRLALLRLGW